MINWLKNSIIKIQLRISAALLTIIIITSIFSASLFRTKSSDVLPPLTKITTQKLKELGTTAKVKAGIYIRFLDTFDVLHNKFVMNTFIWFLFNPKDISLDTIEKFSFVNGDILHKSEAKTHTINDKLLAEYQVKIALHNELTFKYFPYDSHYISIILTNNHVTPQKMIYTAQDQNFNISPIVYLSNWNIKKLTTQYGYFSAQLAKDLNREAVSPQALFIMDIANAGIKNSIIIFVPILFALLLSLFSLLVPYHWKETNIRLIMALSSGATTSLLAYRFVIQSMIPAVGYATLTDLVYTVCLLVSFIIFVIQIMFIIIMQHKRTHLTKEKGSKLAETITCYSSIIFFILSTISLITLYKILLI